MQQSRLTISKGYTLKKDLFGGVTNNYLNIVKEKRGLKEVNSSSRDLFKSADPIMKGIQDQLWKLAEKNTPLMISGEKGTGKSLICRSLFEVSSLKNGPYIEFDANSIPSQEQEKHLLGDLSGVKFSSQLDELLLDDPGDEHDCNDGSQEQNSFQDLQNSHSQSRSCSNSPKPKANGLIHKAQGGFLIIDNFNLLSLNLQNKLWKLISYRDAKKKAGVGLSSFPRIVFITSANVLQLFEKNRIKADLYHGLVNSHVKIPALRHRPQDIPFLSQIILAKIAKHNSNLIGVNGGYNESISLSGGAYGIISSS